MSTSHLLLVVERSRLHEGRWRFGRSDEPHSVWGLMERNEVGGVVVTKLQDQIGGWRDDSATALCLVARCPDEPWIEYDLSWQPIEAPLYRPAPLVREKVDEHRETLAERAERFRRGK